MATLVVLLGRCCQSSSW